MEYVQIYMQWKYCISKDIISIVLAATWIVQRSNMKWCIQLSIFSCHKIVIAWPPIFSLNANNGKAFTGSASLAIDERWLIAHFDTSRNFCPGHFYRSGFEARPAFSLYRLDCCLARMISCLSGLEKRLRGENLHFWWSSSTLLSRGVLLQLSSNW